MNTWIQLIKREYWENKGAFVTLPLVITALIVGLVLVCSLYQVFHSEDISFGFSIWENSDGTSVNENTISSIQYQLGNWASLTVLSGLFSVIILFVSFTYLAGSLYNERADRSILFWKSMPVSDLQTVCAKLLSVAIIPPIIGFAAVLITHLSMLMIFTVITGFSDYGLELWPTLPLFSFSFVCLLSALVNFLWLAPVAAWVLLVSAFVKKSPAMYASLIPVVIIATEALSFKTTVVAQWLGSHINLLLLPYRIENVASEFEGWDESPFSSFLDYLLSGFISADLWIGVLIAVGLIVLTVNVRARVNEL